MTKDFAAQLNIAQEQRCRRAQSTKADATLINDIYTICLRYRRAVVPMPTFTRRQPCAMAARF